MVNSIDPGSVTSREFRNKSRAGGVRVGQALHLRRQSLTYRKSSDFKEALALSLSLDPRAPSESPVSYSTYITRGFKRLKVSVTLVWLVHLEAHKRREIWCVGRKPLVELVDRIVLKEDPEGISGHVERGFRTRNTCFGSRFVCVLWFLSSILYLFVLVNAII